MPNRDLTISELLMLLALDDEEGTIHWKASPYLDYALAGGILSELAARQYMGINETKEVMVSKEEGTEDLDSALHREVFDMLLRSKEARKLSEWVAIVSSIEDLAHRQMEELVERGVLEHHDRPFLFVFHRTHYPMKDSTPEKRIIEKIREAVLGSGDVEPRLGALITLANGAHLLKGPLKEGELDRRQKRLREIGSGQVIGQAACRHIRDAEQALYVASSIPFMGVPQI